jgi:Secretion system C-terminal sorting domain/Carboxylesterase family/alpha/beta hydrolase fold
MKILHIFIFLGSVSLNLSAQQWIDKVYEYDSILNIPYGTAINFLGEEETLFMDIYLPKCPNDSAATKRPLFVGIHGGAFLAGDKNDASIQTFCKDFARRGYVTASLSYRLGFISDNNAWSCNYPNYKCVFASDSTEWARAYYRAVQDCKGGLRYLVNRHQDYKIDIDNIFVMGESAGGFLALGIGLLDTLSEKPFQAFAQPNAPNPHVNAMDCTYNIGKQFNSNDIERPDLGGIEGDIEPSNYQYTIKGIGNMYGAMLSDLLLAIPSGKPKPAIYAFHQPCDLVVPIDSNIVYWGLSWCFTNGYNCYGIANNNIMLYGSRLFNEWNTMNNYGYNIQLETTQIGFPYSFLFGQGSCFDQVANPCHGYDSRSLRERNLATFFADKITLDNICDAPSNTSELSKSTPIIIYPNPASGKLHIKHNTDIVVNQVQIYSIAGQLLNTFDIHTAGELILDISGFSTGIYLLKIEHENGLYTIMRTTITKI